MTDLPGRDDRNRMEDSNEDFTYRFLMFGGDFGKLKLSLWRAGGIMISKALFFLML
jgi:hypothetical protein